MTAEIARTIVLIGWGYVGLGVLFALAFVTVGVRVVEPKARGGSPLFYILIFPGCAALWPLLASKWLRARSSGRDDVHDAHRPAEGS